MVKKLVMFPTKIVAALVGVAVLTGCVTNTTVNLTTVGQQWQCGDTVEKCYFNCPIKLSGDSNLGTGTVIFAGTTEVTKFEVQGVELRWDWCLDDDRNYNCAFVISADSVGRFYNFHGFEGERRKPSDVFSCMKL